MKKDKKTSFLPTRKLKHLQFHFKLEESAAPELISWKQGYLKHKDFTKRTYNIKH